MAISGLDEYSRRLQGFADPLGKTTDPEDDAGSEKERLSRESVESVPIECPPNFGIVASEIYRSSFPRPEHLPFLKRLGLKSILVLVDDAYSDEVGQFVEENGIKVFRVPLSGNKEPFVNMDLVDIQDALQIALDPANQPLMIHCNRGKHRTGCVVGCLRRTQDWALSLIFDEYRRYANPKARALDQLLIERFEPEEYAGDLWA